MQQGVPNSLNISDDLPPAIRGYRRATTHLNTTQNEFGPGSIAIIPLDTGTEGTFIDTRTIRLVFEVDFINRSRYIDFVSFGRSGAAAFIEEIAFEVNGVPIERNSQYAATVELEKIRSGEAQDPFLVSFENPWEPAFGVAGDMHRNFIKPAMVDATGLSWDATKDMYTTLQSTVSLGRLVPLNMALNVANVPYSAGTFCDNSTTGGALNVYPPVAGALGYVGTYASVISGIPYGGPNSQVCDLPKLRKMVEANRRGRNDLKKVLAEGANMKYLPVHHRPANVEWVNDVHFVSWESRVGQTPSSEACALNDATGTHTRYQFSLELYMGILGRFNRKWIPSLAIGAGRAQLRIKFARPHQAFQVSMDPCRRIPGTLRDTIRNSYGNTSVLPSTYGQATSGLLADRSLIMAQKTQDTVGVQANWATNYLRNPIVPCTAAALGTFPSIYGYVPIVSTTVDSEIRVAHNATLAAIAADAVPLLPEELRPVGIGAHAGALTRGCFRYAAPAVCQYMVVSNPWTARIPTGDPGAAAQNVTMESNLCYGTHLPRSRAQSRRTHPGALPLGIPGIEQNYGISYNISNLMIRAEEILFSDAITDSLLSAGVAGNAVMETMVLKETKVQLHQATSQKILIPLTGASIQDICIAFRHTNQLWGDEALSQPTLSFIDPFTCFKYTAPAAGYLKGVDGLTLQSAWSSSNHLGCNIHFQLGAEFLPRMPIDDLQAFNDFVQQGDQIFYGCGELGDYRRMGQMPERMELFSEWRPLGTDSSRKLNHIQDGFFAPYVPMVLLDDQTLTMNPAHVSNSTTDYNTVLGANILPLVEPPIGTFHISLNLETMMGHGHKTRSGSTIVNNQLYLKMDRAYACGDSTLELLAYARCNAKIVFERGGSMQMIS